MAGLKIPNVLFGSDPELFVKKGKVIVGSERVLPEDGIPTGKVTSARGGNRVVQDGIQIELHPIPGPVQALAANILICMKTLQAQLDQFPKVSMCFESIVNVTKNELADLGEKSRQFGCQPSFNAYNLPKKDVDPMEYLVRSAGGHIHIDLTRMHRIYSIIPGHRKEERRGLVPYLDMFPGLISVMLDRNPQAWIRRETYGQAGEFRLPKHGLEYRTLTNFWMRDYALMDLFFGMTSFAVAVYDEILGGNESLEAKMVDAIDLGKVISAIQKNDANLASECFDVVKTFIAKYSTANFPLHANNITKFERFVEDVRGKGIERFIPWDAEEFWLRRPFRLEGFNQFLGRV